MTHIDTLRAALAHPAIEYRPERCWWMAEGLDTTATTQGPWTQLPGVGPEVSGVGGGLGSVVVAGSQPIGFDTSVPTVDVTGMLTPGDNEIVACAPSSLSNRLRARGYYETLPDMMGLLSGRQRPHDVPVRRYGRVGPVRLVRAE